ncbi:MAG: hypothetical protein CVU79_00380 [Elusimicrobia bacterium HGW-Elusimicrobia-3]|jgi:O-antigen/teichoic acid export membrane protein|nr:MAG: hypothetical protein CVU79_00380 [Elusimicrobia bacterium HGW-Elusimicrobia-3]
MNRDFLILSTGRIIQSAIGIVSIRLLTSLLSPAEVGNYYLIFAVIGFCTLTFISPLGFYMNRKLHGWAEHRIAVSRYKRLHHYLLLVFILSFFAVFLLNKTVGIGGSLGALQFALITGLFLYLSTCNQAIIPAFNMLGRRIHFVVFMALTLCLGLLFSILLVELVSRSAFYWVLGQVIALGVVAIIAWFYFGEVLKSYSPTNTVSGPEPEPIRQIFSFIWPLGLTFFFMWGQNLSYRIIVEKTAGLEFLGMLGVGFGIAAGMAAAMESVVQQLYFPLFYDGINTSDPVRRTQAWNSMAKATLPLYAAFAVMVSCLSPFLMKLLAGERFHASYLFLLCGAWVEFFRMSNNILAGVAHSEMQTRHLVKSYFAGASIAAGGTFLAVQHPDRATLIPFVLILSGLATVSVMYFDMRKLMRLHVFTKELLFSILLSLPFLAAIFLYPYQTDMYVASGIVFAFGAYFLFSQYKLNQDIVSGRKKSALPEVIPADSSGAQGRDSV